MLTEEDIFRTQTNALIWLRDSLLHHQEEPIALIAGILTKDMKTYSAGIGRDDYPAAMEFQEILKGFIEVAAKGLEPGTSGNKFMDMAIDLMEAEEALKKIANIKTYPELKGPQQIAEARGIVAEYFHGRKET